MGSRCQVRPKTYPCPPFTLVGYLQKRKSLGIETKVLTLLYLCYTGKRNDDENAKEKLYVVATHVPMTEFKVGSFARRWYIGRVQADSHCFSRA